MDFNVNSRAIEKLIDYTASGIGSTASFVFSRMSARRDAEVKLISAKGDARAKIALAESQADTMRIIARAQADARSSLISPEAVVGGEVAFGDLVEQQIQFQEQKRQYNIGSVVQQAALELEGKEVPDHQPDHDWTARFFGDVQDVSSEEMQVLWAKVLAGEIERPRSTSIRTLNILRNLDHATAGLFRSLCSACVSIRTDDDQIADARVASLGDNPTQNSLLPYGFGFDQLNRLNEYGLIISDYNSRFDYNWCTELHSSRAMQDWWVIPLMFSGRYWVLVPTANREPKQELQLSGVSLSRSGKELSRAVEIEPLIEYSRGLVSFFRNSGLEMREVDSSKRRPA